MAPGPSRHAWQRSAYPAGGASVPRPGDGHGALQPGDGRAPPVSGMISRAWANTMMAAAAAHTTTITSRRRFTGLPVRGAAQLADRAELGR